MQNKINNSNFLSVSKILNCEPAVIKAVSQVESNGSGFDELGRLKILFEPFIFYKSLKASGIINLKAILPGNEDILQTSWKQNMYGKSSIQWDKLKKAVKINEGIAMESCSWGMFQIMGFNHEAAGYPSVQHMQQGYSIGENEQLTSFSNYIKATGLDDELQTKDFASFARQYNGPLYWKNNYDQKILEAYKNCKREQYQ